MTRVRVIYNALIWQWDDVASKTGSCKLGWMKLSDEGRIIDLNFSLPYDTAEANSSGAKAINANGRLVIPGLHDSHIHVEMLGESSYFVNLSGCDSIQKLQSVLSQHIVNHPSLPWIVGVNWDQTNLGRFPNKADIDEVCSTRPIYLWRACWHIGVANSLALEKSGIDLTATSFTIPGGVIEVDEHGPTGILKERAVELVLKAMGSKSTSDKRNFIEDGLAICRKFGLTAVQTNDEYAVKVYQQLQQEDKLQIRVFLTPMYHEIQDADTFELLNETPRKFSSENASSSESRLFVNRIKVNQI